MVDITELILFFVQGTESNNVSHTISEMKKFHFPEGHLFTNFYLPLNQSHQLQESI